MSKAGPSTFDDMAATVAPYPLGLASFSALGDTRPLASVSTAYSGYGHWTLSEGSILNHKPSWIGGIEYTQPSPTAASRAPQKCLSTLAYASNTKEQAQEIVRDTRKRKFEADPPPMTAGLHKFALDMKKKRQTEEEPTKNITRIDLADLFNRLRKIEHLWSPTDTDGSDGIFMQIFNDPRRRPLWDSIQNAEVQKEFVQPYSITTGYATQCRRLQAFQTDALPLRWPYPVYSDMNVVETTAEVTVLVSDMDGKSPWICGHPGCLGPRHTVQTFTRFQGRNDHDKEHHIPVGHYLCPGQCCLFSVTGHRADLMRAHILHDHPQLGRSYLMHESSWKRNPRNVGKFFPKSEHELQNPNIATFRTTGEMCPKLPRQAEWNIRYSVREMKQEATREQYKSIVSDPFGFAMYADKTEWRYQVRYITIDKGEDIPQGRRISYCPGRTDEFIGLFGSASFRVHR